MPPTGTHSHAAKPILAARSVRKEFRGVPALRGVSLALARGEVHALAGENGAGKSTLIKVLTGAHPDFDGTLELDGRSARFASPADALAAGIAAIHQEGALVGSLRAVDCFFLGRELRTRWGFVDRRRQREIACEACRSAGLDLDVTRAVAELPLHARSRLEIARALHRGARALILDEPTSALGPQESAWLLDEVLRLRARGTAIAFIGHRLEEIYRVADRITVLRDGASVGTWLARDLPEAALVRAMVGRDVGVAALPTAFPPGAEALRLSCPGISLSVRAGEIVGLAGRPDAGAHALLESLFGARGPGAWHGRATLLGAPFRPHSPRESLRQGLGLLTADRKADGIVPGLGLGENILLAARALRGPRWVTPRRERSRARARARELRIRCRDVDQPIENLSGGNQQKALIARLLETGARALLLCEPTRGVDIGARCEIHGLLRKAADAGAAVLLATSDLVELLALSDRILVMRRGAVACQLPRAEASPERVLAAAMGGEA